MDAELGQIESSLAALRWAAGCLWVACRERMAAPIRGATGASTAAELLAPGVEEMMRKLARGVMVAAAAVPLLLLLAPSFRQGLMVQARLWSGEFTEPLISASELRAMAEDARGRGDSEVLAFAALLHRDTRECAEWADAAVRQKRELTWVYAVLLSRAEHPAGAEVWLGALRQWAPDNGFVDALEANRIARAEGSAGDRDYRQRLVKNAEWRAAMQAAFAAPGFDTYAGEQFDLIRAGMRRQHHDDPLLLVEAGGGAMLSWFHIKNNLDTYVKDVLFASAKANEKSRPEEAARIYRQVVAFGNLMERRAWGRWERYYAVYEETRVVGPCLRGGEGLMDGWRTRTMTACSFSRAVLTPAAVKR